MKKGTISCLVGLVAICIPIFSYAGKSNPIAVQIWTVSSSPYVATMKGNLNVRSTANTTEWISVGTPGGIDGNIYFLGATASGMSFTCSVSSAWPIYDDAKQLLLGGASHLEIEVTRTGNGCTALKVFNASTTVR